MNFKSTRGGGGEVSFKSAVFEGLAPDGGLYHPTSIPDLSRLFRSLSPASGYNCYASLEQHNRSLLFRQRDQTRFDLPT